MLGSTVREGEIKRNRKVYIVRDDEIIAEGKIVSMRQGKNDVSQASKGSDFGFSIDGNVDEVEVGDVVHCYDVVK